jgi:hypothetical protein
MLDSFMACTSSAVERLLGLEGEESRHDTVTPLPSTFFERHYLVVLFQKIILWSS